MPKVYKTTFVFAFFLFSLAAASFAVEDNFDLSKKIESKYFKIFYDPGVEIFSLAQRLNILPSDKLLAGSLKTNGTSTEEEIANMVDSLFLRVAEILDMRLYSFRGTIKICKDYNQLSSIYMNLFNNDLKGMRSFYVFNINTIYIPAEDFKYAVLGHEIGHAIINNYFAVLPAAKVQEILSTYVDYQLRKQG